jgi:hypothetical protein
MTSPPPTAATINADPARMNIRPSGPISPPAPVSAPALGVLDLRWDGVTVTVAVLVLVGLGVLVVGVVVGVVVGLVVGVVVGLLDGEPLTVPTTRLTEGPPEVPGTQL